MIIYTLNAAPEKAYMEPVKLYFLSRSARDAKAEWYRGLNDCASVTVSEVVTED